MFTHIRCLFFTISGAGDLFKSCEPSVLIYDKFMVRQYYAWFSIRTIDFRLLLGET
jgi:hypothetical protein